MGADYYVFTEAQIDDEWVLIDPLFWNHTKKQYECVPTYYNGSRTCFSNAYYGLTGCGTTCTEEDIKTFSPQLIKHLRYLYSVAENEPLPTIGSGISITIVPYNEFKERLDLNSYDYEGFVSINSANDLESIDPDNILTAKEWVKLTPSMQGNFDYRTWDDPYGWRYHFKEIYKSVENRLIEYMDCNWLLSEPTLRLIVLMDY